MKQSEINDYNRALEKVIAEYLSSNPDPEEHISSYFPQITEKDNMFPLDWFDVGVMTPLIRNHKDTKDQYEVHPCTIEMLVTMFRMGNHKLGWLDDENAADLAGYLSYDKPTITRDYVNLLHEFMFCVLRFPYQAKEVGWYYYLLPIFAYTKQYDFKKTNYVTRYLLSMIDRYGTLVNRGEHNHDIVADPMRCLKTLQDLMIMCKKDNRFKDEAIRYNYYRNVLSEFATVMLACLMQRSATVSSFGVIAKEIVATHHIEYQLITQEYFKQAAKENFKL